MGANVPPALSVVIPAFNEATRLAPTLQVVLAYLKGLGQSWELLVVDDVSRDDTAAEATAALAGEAAARVISYQPNRGKGFAVRTGVLAARGGWVVFLDADLSTPVAEIAPAITLLQAGHDMVVGSRGHPQARISRRPPPLRRVASRFFDGVRNLLVGLAEFYDTQCGFKAYRRAALVPLFQRAVIERFMFDVEILYLARRSGLKVVEIPVAWADAPGSTVRFWPGLYQMFRDLLRIRWVHRGFEATR